MAVKFDMASIKAKLGTAISENMENIADTDLDKVGQAMVHILQGKSGGLPASVAAHFNSVEASEATYSKGMTSATIKVTFTDDLSRESLVRRDGTSADGIDDIVSLFDTGYHADKRAYGYYANWGALKRDPSEGKSGDMMIPSKTDRDGLGFMQEACDDFNAAYGEFTIGGIVKCKAVAKTG